MNSSIIKHSLEPAPPPEFHAAAGRPPQGANLRILRSLRMHRGLAIAVTIVVCLAIAAFGLSRKAEYQAQSLIYVQPVTAKLMTDATSGAYDAARYDSYIQQQLQTIVRSDILSEALRKLPPGTWQRPGESEQSAIARLQKDLDVERVLGSYQLSITLKGNNAAAITAVVNQVTAAYLEKGRGDELAQSDQQLQILTEDRQHIQDDLEKDRQEQAGLSSVLGVADTAGVAGDPYDVQLETLRQQVAAATSAHEIATAELASVSSNGAQPSAALNAAAEETTGADPGLTALETSNMQRRSFLTSQMSGLTPSNPVYKQDQQELALLNQSLDDAATSLRVKAGKQLQGKLRLDVSRAADVQSRLESQLAQQTAIATSSTPKLQRAADVAADIVRLQARFTDVDNAVNSLQLEHSSSGLVHLSLGATQPQRPLPSKRLLILALAFPVGLFFGALAAVARRMIDPKVYIAEDVQSVLQFQPMTVLPNPLDVTTRVVDEFMLRLAAGVDQAHRAADVRTYVFTATSPDVGITDLVASLAVKMNQIGYRTMILEASAALHNLSPAEQEIPDDWDETDLVTASETRIAPLKRESFAAENFERLKENVDLLFIEALPILSSAEAEFVSRLADATILVAESAQTTRRDLSSSLALVRRLGASGVAAVLKDVNLRDADDEFIASVRSVESRRSEVWSRE
jgi:uncharacterized protein involved in exopolysaccharide biosynthesis